MTSIRRICAVRPVPIHDAGGVVLPAADVVYSTQERTAPNVVAFSGSVAGEEVLRCEFDHGGEAGNAEGSSGARLEVRLADGSVLFTGDGGVRPGAPFTIDLKTVEPVRGFRRFVSADLRWWLRIDGEWRMLDTAGMQMDLFLLELHDGPLQIREKGAPLALLRWLADPMMEASDEGHSQLSSPRSQAIIRKIFSSNPPRYDSYHGAPHFVDVHFKPPNGTTVTLYYARYQAAVANPSMASILNCYDAASLAQNLLQYVTKFRISWIFMKPFGYLKLTDLIGWGQCNNPFFQGDTKQRVVKPTAKGRTAFGNHAFCYMTRSGREVDACAGPHLGTETDDQYVAAAIDTVTPSPPAVPAGRVADMKQNPGVTRVDQTVSSRVDMAMNAVSEFVAVSGFDWAVPSAPAGVRPLLSPLECGPIGTAGWKIVYEEILPGHPEAQRHWRLQRGEGAVTMSIFVSSEGAEMSRHRFLRAGSLHQMPDNPFARGPSEFGEFSAIIDTPDYIRLLWVHGNAMVDLEAHAARDEAFVLARWVQASLAEPTLLLPLERLIRSGVTVSATDLRVNDRVTISATGGSRFMLDIDGAHQGLRYAERRPDAITLIADLAGQSTFDVIIVDRSTLGSERHSVSITVRDGQPSASPR